MSRTLAFAFSVFLLLSGSAQAVVTLDWATIGNPNNTADTRYDPAGFGAVDYVYRISKHEINYGDYAEFLNAVAKDDTAQLYSTSTFYPDAGITREGTPGNYTYSLKSPALDGTYNFAQKPAAFVNVFSAFRFANWMHNGQPNGPVGPETTETGAYDLTQGLVPQRSPNARFFLPTEDEWYKAAYFTPEGSYFDYPTKSNTAPDARAPSLDTGNSANFLAPPSPSPTGSDLYRLTDVGAYKLSASPWGTFDQAGNLAELTETFVESATGLPDSVVRGAYYNDALFGSHASVRNFERFANGNNTLTFRLAAAIPEPTTITLAALVYVGLVWHSPRRGCIGR